MTVTVIQTMGTVASLHSRGREPGAADIRSIREVFDRWEQRFSLYEPDSELSRIVAGQLQFTAASEQLLATFAAANDWRAATGGNFTPNRPDGVVDLDGIVKALAIAEVGEVLVESGLLDWSLNVGGDVLVHGSPSAGTPAPVAPWVLGIVDPDDRGSLLCSLELVGSRRAIATSGTSERGEHVWRTGSDDQFSFSQVSVLADDIVTADVLATAILAGGSGFCDIATTRWAIDVVTVTRAGEIAMTPGARSALAT